MNVLWISATSKHIYGRSGSLRKLVFDVDSKSVTVVISGVMVGYKW